MRKGRWNLRNNTKELQRKKDRRRLIIKKEMWRKTDARQIGQHSYGVTDGEKHMYRLTDIEILIEKDNHRNKD
jgi:hypothetical protein